MEDLIQNVSLVDDQFIFSDLSFPKILLANGGIDYISSSPYSTNIFSIDYYSVFLRPTDKFYIRYDLNSRIIVCDLKEKLEKIIHNPDSTYFYYSKILLKSNKDAYNSVIKILEDLNNGSIVINDIRIDLANYKPRGEYFKIYMHDGKLICLNRVKKYYSIVDDQYTFFLADGSIKSYSNVASVEMSKDVRLTKEELERLWK